MLPIENDAADGKIVFLDDRYFINCKYTKCSLIYTGGDVGWQGTQFIECRLAFDGAAARTIKFLENVGMMKKMEAQLPKEPPTSTSKPN